MAEFCKDCFKLINESYYHDEELVMSEEEDFCEGCCEYKKVVVGIKNSK
jgi:hypothetical protein